MPQNLDARAIEALHWIGKLGPVIAGEIMWKNEAVFEPLTASGLIERVIVSGCGCLQLTDAGWNEMAAHPPPPAINQAGEGSRERRH